MKLNTDELLDAATGAAREAGEMLKKNLGSAGEVEYKGVVDIVTEMDRKSEELIKDRLRSAFPDCGIIAEESDAERSSSENRWIIDPLDGTTNYAHGFPFFCVSIAFEDPDGVRLGAVYDPMLDELFTAWRGGGAHLNGRPIKVSSTDLLTRGLLATGFPYDIRTSEKNNLDHFSRFSLRSQAIRRAGSAALDLCYVACGRFDGFWEMKLQAWDVAAGSIIITEAGGRVTDYGGGEFSIYGNECLATNGTLHEEMMAVLSGKA